MSSRPKLIGSASSRSMQCRPRPNGRVRACGRDSGQVPDPLLSVRDLTVHYGSTPALHRLDLDVAQDELLVLLGGSGSGKTTLLRAIAGLVRPTSGQIV